jgi:SNF2 family DNA or RNA helicase
MENIETYDTENDDESDTYNIVGRNYDTDSDSDSDTYNTENDNNAEIGDDSIDDPIFHFEVNNKTMTLIEVKGQKYWHIFIDNEYTSKFYKYINENTAGKQISNKLVMPTVPPIINSDNYPKPYPCKFFAYYYNNTNTVFNPYNYSILRQTSNLGSCYFLDTKIKENILYLINELEYPMFLTKFKKNFLMIIKVEDISEFYNIPNFNKSDINFVSNENIQNTQKQFYQSLNTDNDKYSFKSYYYDKKFNIGKKCYRATMVIYDIPLINKWYTYIDGVSKTINSLISKSKPYLNNIHVFDNFNPEIQKAIQFIYYNTVKQHNYDCYNLTKENVKKIIHGNYCVQYYYERNNKNNIGIDFNGFFEIQSQLIFTDANIDEFNAEMFYPFRLIVPLLMKMKIKKFVDFINKSLLLNCHRISICDKYISDILRLGILFSNTIKSNINISVIETDDTKLFDVYNNIYTETKIIDNKIPLDFKESFNIFNKKYKLKIEFTQEFINELITNKIQLSSLEIKKIFNTEFLYNFYSKEFNTLLTENKIFNILSDKISENNKKLKSSNIDYLKDKITIYDKLFTYQKININWMKNIEKDIAKKKLFVTTKYKYDILPEKKYTLIFNYKNNKYCNSLFNGNTDNISNIQLYNDFIRENYGKLYIKGGIIADDIGLGKTASMICHIINQLEYDNQQKHIKKLLSLTTTTNNNLDLNFEGNNLIILPSHLVIQWEMEINKIVNLLVCPIKILILNTIRDIKKFNNLDIQNYDIVLMCKNIIYKSNYENLINEDNNYINIYTIKWNRIIIDEAHECLSLPFTRLYDININSFKKLKNTEYIGCYLNKLKSNYRWCITGTPFCYGLQSLYGIMKFLLVNDNIYTPINKDTIEKVGLSIFLKELVQKSCDFIPITETEKKLLIEKYPNIDKLQLQANSYYIYKEKYIPYLGIEPEILIKCMSVIIKQTTKKDVKEEINIPSFIEKRIYVDFTNLERKMYDLIINNPNEGNVSNSQINLNNYSDQPTLVENLNTMKLDIIPQNFIKTALQFCTNLLIQHYFSNSIKNEFSKFITNENEIISIEDLQKLVVEKINIEKSNCIKLLNEVEQQLNYYNLHFKTFNNLKLLLQNELIKKPYFKQEDKYDKFNYLTNNPDYSFIILNINKKEFKIAKIIIDEVIISYLIEHNDILSDQPNIEILEIILCDDKLYTKLKEKLIINKKDEDSFYINNNFNKKLMSFIISNPKSLLLLTLFSLEFIDKSIKKEELINKSQTYKSNIEMYDKKAKFFTNETIKEQINEPCMICYDTIEKFIITDCRHIMCCSCFNEFVVRCGGISKPFPCPACRTNIDAKTVLTSRVSTPTSTNLENDSLNYKKIVKINGKVLKSNWKYECINKYGSKMSVLLEYLGELLEVSSNRIIIFSNFNSMLNLISIVLDKYNIKYVNCKGNIIQIGKSITNFKKNENIRIILLSTESFNSGNNLTEANHVIFIDVINNVKETVINIEKQAIGRAVRLGQNKGVVLTRFIMRNTIEELILNRNNFNITTIE